MSPRRRAAKTIHAILFDVVDDPSASEIASVIAGSGAHEKARRVRAGGVGPWKWASVNLNEGLNANLIALQTLNCMADGCPRHFTTQTSAHTGKSCW